MISDINVTPFVDIMLVLLVVFMIAAPTLVPTIDVDLPNTASKPYTKSENNTSIIVITVTKNGEIYLQDKLIKLSDIRLEMSKYLADNKDVRVFLKGDKSITYDTIMHTIAAIKSAGLANVSLVTNTEFS